MRTGRVTKALLGHNAPVYRICINPAGSRVASLDHAGELCIWDNGTTLLHHQALPVLAAHSLAYSPDGKDLAVATQDNRILIVPVPPNVQ